MNSYLPCLLSVLALVPLAAHGTVVTTTADEDDGSLGGGTGVSLREAVKYPGSTPTVTFAPALSGQTIRLTRGEILISLPVTINGSALASRITISGDRTGNGKTADDSAVFRIGANPVTLDSLIISGGYETQGGGIISNLDTALLTVKRCHFAGNSADVVGGAIFFSKSTGAATPRLTLTDSTFTGNSAANEGGAIYAIYPVQIQTTTFTGNSARQGGAIFLQAFNGTSIFEKTTFTGNSATKDGGAIYLSRGVLQLKQSTIAANTSATSAGGIACDTAFLRATLLCGNRAPTDSQLSGTLEGDHGNLITPILSLAPLGNYGGLTQTMPPIIGSPAIDPPQDSSFNNTDQRGFPRDDQSDIGAVEYKRDQSWHDDPSITSRFLHLFWADDADQDGLPYAMERLHGTQPFLPDSPGTAALSPPVTDANGHRVLTFSIADDPDLIESRTLWKLLRSTHLHPGSFQEIHRFGLSEPTSVHGVTASYAPDPADPAKQRVTITDTLPTEGGRAFYRFEALLDSH